MNNPFGHSMDVLRTELRTVGLVLRGLKRVPLLRDVASEIDKWTKYEQDLQAAIVELAVARQEKWFLDSKAVGLLVEFFGEKDPEDGYPPVILQVQRVNDEDSKYIEHGLSVVLQEYPEEGALLLVNSVPREKDALYVTGYDDNGNVCLRGAFSMSDTTKEFHIMESALELVRAYKRGVKTITPDVLFKHLVGEDYQP